MNGNTHNDMSNIWMVTHTNSVSFFALLIALCWLVGFLFAVDCPFLLRDFWCWFYLDAIRTPIAVHTKKAASCLWLEVILNSPSPEWLRLWASSSTLTWLLQSHIRDPSRSFCQNSPRTTKALGFLIHPHLVTALVHKRSRSFCQKCRLQLNMHAPCYDNYIALHEVTWQLIFGYLGSSILLILYSSRQSVQIVGSISVHLEAS